MTIYYEAGIPASLIPVQFIGWAPSPHHDLTGHYEVVVRVRRTRGSHKAGDTLHLPLHSVVVKSGTRDGFIRVRAAPLPKRTDANTLNTKG